MYEFFPGNYSWSLGALMAVQLGGELSEVAEACAPLRPLADSPDARHDPEIQRRWTDAWLALAERTGDKARRDEAAGHGLSAGRKYRRATVYYQQADRMAGHGDPRKPEIYAAMLAGFRKAVTLSRDPVAWVEVPYGDASLPALFIPGLGPGPRPCMIGFDGFDVTKEWTHLVGLSGELRRRGLSTLIVDHPGVGEALRLRGMPTLVETERPAAACVDLLQRRADVDPARIGIMAMSLGGYFAPRAAAFEPRLAACVAWGARWDNAGSHGRILRDPTAARSIPGWVEHALRVYGQPTVEACAAMIARMTLEGVAEHIRCPLLVVHGENDQQVPLDQAQRTVDAAVNAPRRDLRLFSVAEGGAEHVNGDNFGLAVDVIADWCADVLGGDAAGVTG